MRTIFVSYSRLDHEPVSRMVAKLLAAGYRVWHDQKLTGGQKWWDNILAEIRECEVVVFALSAAALESEACRKELEYAVALGKTPIPVQVADDVHAKNLPQPLSEFNVVDYRAGDESATLKLVNAVNTSPPAPALPVVMPVTPAIPVSYLGSLNDKIMAQRKLSDDEQYAICTHLSIARTKGHTVDEIHELAERAMKREDLLAVVRDQILQLLATLEPHAPKARLDAVDPGAVRSAQSDAGVSAVVAGLVRRYASNIICDTIFHVPAIPAAKLARALPAMGCVEPAENVLMLCDTSVFGTGESGWMITTLAFYHRYWPASAGAIRWRDLHTVTWTAGWFNRAITLNQTHSMDVPQCGVTVVQSLGLLLQEISREVGGVSSVDVSKPG